MRAGFMELRDDIGDRCSYTWNLLQPVLRNKPIERDGKRGKTIRRAGIGLGALRVSSTQR